MPEPGINKEYLSFVAKDLAIIADQWPDLRGQQPLPLSGTTGYESLVGYGAPFDSAAYDAQYPDDNFQYGCSIHFMWQDFLTAVLHDVPLYWDRVVDYAKDQVRAPGLLRFTSYIVASVVNGDDVPIGGLQRLSPCEQSHGVLHSVATRIAAKAPPEELKGWLRTLLSAPAIFLKKKSHDEKFAEASSLRQDADEVAKTVVFSARQFIYLIGNFKEEKERQMNKSFGSKMIANFWRENVRGHNMMATPSAIDTCLTVKDRVFVIPGVEDLIIWFDKQGLDSWVNTLNKLQEVVYRCKKGATIAWFIRSLKDMILAGKITNDEITNESIKSGKRSLSDPILVAFDMKRYLLGEWLDGRSYPIYVKVKYREIVASHDSWRSLWHPLPDDSSSTLDVTWKLTWPKAYKDLLDFIESAVYELGHREESSYKSATTHSLSTKEILEVAPWNKVIEDLDASMTLVISLKTSSTQGADDDNDAQPEITSVTGASDGPKSSVSPDVHDELTKNSEILSGAVKNLIQRQTSWINDVDLTSLNS